MSDEQNTGYDPDQADREVEKVTPGEFGIRLARHIREVRSSGLQGAVGQAFEHLDPFGLEWSTIEKLVNQIAASKLPGE